MRSGNLQYAVLGLVASQPEGVHGYKLKADFDALSDDFWQVNYGRLYRVLDHLEQRGDLEAVEEVQSGRPNKKVYRLTERGRQSLDDWLLQPVSDDPQPLRDEISLRLLFLREDNVEALAELIKQQRSIYLTRLARIARRRRKLEKSGVNMKVVGLIMDGAEMRVRADITWLEHIERKIVRTF